jgi:hypothetical protein
MKRACHVTLEFATARKRRAVATLLQSYRAAVNFFLRSLWHHPGALDAATLGRLGKTRLSQRFKSQALKQALEIVTSTRKSEERLEIEPTCPLFTGAAVLDGKFVGVEECRGSFDLIIRLSCLQPAATQRTPIRSGHATGSIAPWLLWGA